MNWSYGWYKASAADCGAPSDIFAAMMYGVFFAGVNWTMNRTKKSKSLVMESVLRAEEGRHEELRGEEIGSSGSVLYGSRSASRMEASVPIDIGFPDSLQRWIIYGS